MAQKELSELVGKIIDQPASRIVVGNGAAELIKIVSGTMAQKLIIPVPSFNEYANAAPPGQVVEFPLDFPSFKLDVDKFTEAAIKAKADIAVVVSPNNPTSLLVPKSDIIRLIISLAKNNCMLILDESFLDFSEDPEQTSIEKDIDKYPNLAIFKSMSKAYGICGLRIGYLLTANSQFAERVRAGIPIWNLNGFAEEFLRQLPDFKEEFTESCKQVRNDRDILYKELSKLKGMVIYRPDANYIYCRVPDKGVNGPELAKSLFVKHNIFIKDCAGKTQPEADRYLRIASRTKVENQKLVTALVDVMSSETKEG
ncbi:MAG: histidinol-phosphate aminotransferase family protein [Spirochaetales bacterium]|nr:histidinol-phosphate aminotransferase family protein [Spirochaetales bacterium]